MLFLSNLLFGKGHWEIVEGFSQLPPVERDKIRIDFAGRIDSVDEHERFLSAIESYPQLRYNGVVHGEEKKALLANAHTFLLPTYYPYEGQPICILEAYASGCAVITTDHSGIFDTFSDGVNGIAVEKMSSISLRDAFSKIALDPQAIKPAALNNMEKAKREFTKQRYIDDLLTIFRDAKH